MTTRHTDYYVRSRSEEEIAGIAQQWRAKAERILGDDFFNMVDFVKLVLQSELRPYDPLTIAFLEKGAGSPVAKVSFKPLTLSVNVTTWAGARASDEADRYVLAHESGHVVMHDNEAKGFSGDTAERIPASNREQSAEWQADVFADHLLAPLHIVSRYKLAHEVAIRCGVPISVAERQLEQVAGYWESGSPYGDACEHCNSYDTWIMTNSVRCRSCGKKNALIF